MQKNENYSPLLRCKITTSGAHAVRCWGEQGQKTELPADLRGVPVIARLHVERLWQMSKEYGLVLTCTDIQCMESAGVGSTCPFVS